jgi:hypothetical protein
MGMAAGARHGEEGGGRLLGIVGGEDADVGEVAVALGVVHAVADDEEVGDGEADVVGGDFLDAA